MTLTVRADPKRPNGGYAQITAPAGALPEGDAQVTIFDAFSERYLGDGGWQTEATSLGPYPVTHDGDTARLVVGAEVVNEVEEYAVLKVTVGSVTDEVNWPDDVFPLPGAARLGGLHVTRSDAPVAKSNLVKDVPPEPVAPPSAPVEIDPVAPEPVSEPGKSRTPMLIGVGVLVLALIAAAAWYLTREEMPPAPDPAPAPVKDPVPASEPENPCGADAFGAIAGASYGERSALMLRCAGSLDPDTAFGIIDDGAVAGDPQALALMGALYDPEVDDDAVETQIGVALSPAMPLAAEYYARAVDAGNTEVAARLAQVCETLRAETDTESRNAVEEFCPQ